MPKPLLASALCLFALTACTTVADDESDDCTIAGTYSLTGEIESGNCPEGDGEGSSTITISPAAPGSDADFVLEFQGLEGACPLTRLSACKLQGKCSLTLSDAIDPRNAVGSIQYTWAFTRSGFTGFSALSVPPAKSVPDGCSQTTTNTGTLR